YEECITRAGFEGPYSILYHLNRPHTHMPCDAQQGASLPEEARDQQVLRKRLLKTSSLATRSAPPMGAREPLLYNEDVVVAMSSPALSDPVYFANGDADDLHFVMEGEGVVRSAFGDLAFGPLDYVCVPKGVVHRFVLDGPHHRWLSLECLGGVGL